MTHRSPPMDAVPALDDGLTLLETPGHRVTALHRIALTHLRQAGGTGVWFDARGNAATYLLQQEGLPTPDLEIARAFTAYQHHELVRTLPGDLPRDLELVVLPNVTSLYNDPDVPDWESERYLASSLAILEAVADLIDVPVLVSATADSPTLGRVRDVAARTITFEQTDLGFRFEAPGFETTVYWGDGYFQTTIPYWVELLGAVDESTPAIAADEAGMVPATV